MLHTHKRLQKGEMLKNENQLKFDLDSIPNTELKAAKCSCGSVLWEVGMILWEIPSLHPKNGYGERMSRGQGITVCKKCGKAHPDQLDPKDKSYISNLPEELK